MWGLSKFFGKDWAVKGTKEKNYIQTKKKQHNNNNNHKKYNKWKNIKFLIYNEEGIIRSITPRLLRVQSVL